MLVGDVDVQRISRGRGSVKFSEQKLMISKKKNHWGNILSILYIIIVIYLIIYEYKINKLEYL